MHEGRNRDKCPKCRCKGVTVTDLMSAGNGSGMDAYVHFNCTNCWFLVGLIDNSPYYSCYDFEDFIIHI